MPPDRGEPRARRRRFLADGVLIFLLFGVALAQPLYGVLARGAEFFVARRSEPIDVLSLVTIVSLLLPGALVAAEAALGLLGERARSALHRVIAGALFGGLFLQGLKRLESMPDAAVVALAAVAGVALGWGLAGWRRLRSRTFLIAGSLAALALPLWFLVATPVRKVLLQDRTASATNRCRSSSSRRARAKARSTTATSSSSTSCRRSRRRRESRFPGASTAGPWEVPLASRAR